MNTITPFLWFNDQAEEAVDFYVSVFPESRVDRVLRYGPAGPGPDGSVMTVDFWLRGQQFVALNGGPVYSFTPAVSFVVNCDTQAEIDTYWDALTAGGEPGPCGWVTDRYGISWQVVPTLLTELLTRGDEGSMRVTKAMLQMGKLVIDDLERAYAGA